MNKKEKINYLVPLLFIIYIALLIWIILFKLQLSINKLDTVRNINLIPFYYSNEIDVKFHLTEVLQNVIIFIPFGIYLCMLRYNIRFLLKFLLIFGTSIILETAQYILAIGRSDITDLITNTCGGMLGIVIYYCAVKLFQSRKLANKIIVIFASVTTVIVFGLLSILLISN